MKKKVIIFSLLVLMVLSMCGCSDKTMARNYGGESKVDLKPGEKLEEVTWKDNNLWILTRPMREGETAEKYTFTEDSEFGIIEGTVYIIEHETK